MRAIDISEKYPQNTSMEIESLNVSGSRHSDAIDFPISYSIKTNE